MLPGDILTLKECALEAQGFAGQPLSVVAHVYGPIRNILPQVLLSAPAKLGACNQLVVDGMLSSVVGPQQPQVRWIYQGPDQLQHEVIDLILAQASVKGDLRITLDFPRLLGVDTGFGIFSFNLTLRNTITRAVRSSAIVVERRQTDAPSVRLSQARKFCLCEPCHRILTGCQFGLVWCLMDALTYTYTFAETSVLTIRRWEPINLAAIVDRSECSAAGELQFGWNATNALHGVSSDTALLYVPPFSMLPGATADIFVSVSTESSSETGVASVSVECVAESIVANIRSGDRTVGSVGVFTIDATGSLDPDDPENERDSFEYSARCTPLAGSDGVRYINAFSFGCVKNDQIYVDGTTTSTYTTRLPASIGAINHDTGEIVLIWPDGDLRHRFTDVTHAYKDGVRCADLVVVSYPSCDARAGPHMVRDAEEGLFAVNPMFLEAGGTYRFEVTASKGSRADNASVEVLISELPAVPSVVIDFPVQTKYNAAHRLALQARQEDGRPLVTYGDAAVGLMWTVEDDDGEAITMQIGDGFLATLPTSPNLIVNPHSLHPGSCYRFSVTVTSSVGASSFASVHVCTNSAPRGGDMTVQPRQGVALTTKFVLTASSWWDEDMPLRYRFGFELDGRSASLTAFSPTRIVQTVLPPGSYPATCLVADAYTAVSQAVQVSVSVSEYLPTESLSLDMNRAFAEAHSSGDLSAVAGLVDVFAVLLQQLTGRRRLQGLATSTYEDIEEAILVLIVTLRGLVEQLPMVADTVSRLSRTLDVALTSEVPRAAIADSVAVLVHLTEGNGVREHETSTVLLHCAGALLASSSSDLSPEISTAILSGITNMISELTSGRLAGEYAFVMQNSAFALTVQTESNRYLERQDLGYVRLPSGVFPNDTAAIHVQHISWHCNPRPWAPEHPVETRGNLSLGSNGIGFAMHPELDELTPRYQRTFSLVLSPLLVRFAKGSGLVFDDNESHWHCGMWSQEVGGWTIGGTLLEWHGTHVSCAYDDHRDYTGHLGTFVTFWGEIPPEKIIPVNPLAFYISLFIPVAVMLCGLVMVLTHVFLWKDLNVMLFRKKAVVSYLGSTFAAFEYPSGRQAHCCRRMIHKMRVRVNLCTVLCGYSRIPQLPKAQRMLVLLTDMAVIISLNSIFQSEIDKLYMTAFLAIFGVPAHILVDYMLKWLNAPTISWLRTEFELQQAFASASFANKRAGVRSKSFAAGKSFNQGSARPLAFPAVRSSSIRSSVAAPSFKSPSVVAGASFLSPSFASFKGSMKSTDGSMSHTRHRSVLSVLGVICSVLFISALFSSITLWLTLRFTNAEFVDLMVRSSITCGGKWVVVDPMMALTVFPLLARWDAARLARRVGVYAPEDDTEEREDEEASPGRSPRKQVQIENQVVPQLETKYERAARDRALRISGKQSWEWKRDQLGSYKARNPQVVGSSATFVSVLVALVLHLRMFSLNLC